ncbi:MAG: DUF2256 domain-containing protein [SAR86 cluster bacterium]|nr:DUF2256 domain-containing protein [SAR86 cluster bacterium]
MHNKLLLPTKTCQNCLKSFSWRKKWKRDWESIKFCSLRCKKSNNKERI